MERDDGSGRGWLPQADVGDGAAAAEDADPALAPPRVGGDAVEDVAAASHLEDVGAERVGALPRNDDRRLRLVLGPRRPTPRAASHHVAGAADGAQLQPRLVGTIFRRVGALVVGVFFGILLLLLLLLLLMVLKVEVWSVKVLNEA